jgi:hypothetical protein
VIEVSVPCTDGEERLTTSPGLARILFGPGVRTPDFCLRARDSGSAILTLMTSKCPRKRREGNSQRMRYYQLNLTPTLPSQAVLSPSTPIW